MSKSSDLGAPIKRATTVTKSDRTSDQETSMDSDTPFQTIGPRPSPADAKLWQSVHDYLDNPPPLAVLFRNPWKWLNSRTPKKP